MDVDVDAIVKQILNAAAASGDHVWQGMKHGAPLYVKAYAQTIADIAKAVADGEMTKEQGEDHAQTAQLLLVQGIAFTSQVILSEAQKFIDGIIDTLKSAINAKLPVAVL